MSSLSSVILAAGPSAEMNSGKAKVAHEVCFTPIINLVYNVAKNIGIDNIITVIGTDGEDVKTCLGQDKKYVFQQNPLGTGHAVMTAMDQLNDGDTLLVLSGDVPLITEKTLKSAIDYHFDNRFAATVITANLDNPTGYGRILRDENLNVQAIIEEKDATTLQKQITEVNSGMYCFDIGILRAALSDLKNNNSDAEYYLTDTIEILIENGYNVGAYRTEDSSEICGVNNRVQLAAADAEMRKRVNEKLMFSGVTLIDPSATYISADAQIGRDVTIYPNCVIKGGSRIGEGTIIGQSCMIDTAQIGKDCEVLSSVITQSTVGNNVHIGPFAYIRPGCTVGDNIKVGDFVELKNSNIKNGTKIAHLTYVGDSDVGENVNFGCGTVTVNYDSKKKYRTTIGDNAFIGCNSNLVAPVTIGNGAYTAAGSTVTEDVPDDSLVIARSRQVVKTGWVKKKKF